MKPYLNSTFSTAFSPQSSSPYSFPTIPHSLIQHNKGVHHLYQSHSIQIHRTSFNKSCGIQIVCSESYGSKLSTSVLEKPRKSFQLDIDNTNTTTTLTTKLPLPAETKPFGAIGIVSFFKGKNCLITGATGFVAKVIVEKILRMVPEAGKIFVLIKAKDKEAAMERLKVEIIDCELFKRIKEVHGKGYMEFMMRKLIPVVGNVCESELGMDATTANDIAKNVHVILNSAATTSFDERYDVALNTNTKGPSRLLNFAKKCKNICVFLHISTVYVNGGERQGIIMEKPLGREIPELDIDAEIKLASDILSSIKQNQATQKMKELGLERASMYGWPNTYSFTKAMGEMLINSFSFRGGIPIPVVILRPAVIESSYADPFPGWIEGYRVLEPLFCNYGKGQLPAFLGDPKAVMDVIPVDMVANATMAAIAKHGGVGGRGEVSVYQIGSSVGNPVSVGALFDYACAHFSSFPLNGNGNGKKNNQICIKKMNFFNSLDDFSSYISMEMAKQSGCLEATILEPKLQSTLQRKSKKKADLFIQLAKLYQPYMFYKAWFDNRNTQKLLGEMSNEEMKNFGFDVGSINWEQYISSVHIPGVRSHLLKPSVEVLKS